MTEIIEKETPIRKIPFSPPDISEAEIEEVTKVLRSGWITTGPRTKQLEGKLAAFIETGCVGNGCDLLENMEKYQNRVVCLNSATAAEELNLRILGIGEGDEVIVPAYTYTASAAAVLHVGATPIFIDSQPDSTEMDYEQMETVITPRTKAILAVDIGGILCDYHRIFHAVQNKRELFTPGGNTKLGIKIQRTLNRIAVLADSAHALGASREGKMAGQIADFTSFSFHAVKNFTTAEGGASTWRKLPGIEDEEIYHQYQLFSLHGQTKDALSKNRAGAWEYDIVGAWYKCNMTDIAAAIGLRQLDRYPAMLARRKEIIVKYDAVCDEIGVKHLIHYGNDFSSSGHLYLARVPRISDGMRREIIEKLAERGVSTNVHYKPLPMMSAYKELGWEIKDFPQAYAYYENLITLPLHTKLSDQDVEYVISNFKEIVTPYLTGKNVERTA